ncbi:hypothetical protein V6N13_043121 [Hibiscus sabdariffa]
MWSTTIVATTVPIVSPGVVSPSAVGVDSLTVVRASSTPASAELGSTMAHLESSPHSSSNDTLSRNTNEMEHGVRDSMPSPALVSLESVSRQSSTECDPWQKLLEQLQAFTLMTNGSFPGKKAYQRVVLLPFLHPILLLLHQAKGVLSQGNVQEFLNNRELAFTS